MEKLDRKRVYSILLVLVVYSFMFITAPYIKDYITSYKDLKNRMYYDFKDFGESLEVLNSNLSRILVLEELNINKEYEYVSKDRLRNFQSSAFNSESLDRTSNFHDFIFMYSGTNSIIQNILRDETISINEKEYLETLYEYNNNLIEDYKSIIGVLYYKDWDYEKSNELRKNIVGIYNEFCSKADNLLDSPKYKLLKEYRGSFKENSKEFEKIKAHCEIVFSKLVNDQTLEYDNRDKLNSDKYIFTTYEKRDETKPFDRVDYSVEYDKNTNEISVTAVSFSVFSKTPKYEEKELDSMVDDVVDKFNMGAFNYNKEVHYDNENSLEEIRYSYIIKNDNVYDEFERINIVIQPHGLINRFTIFYSSNKDIPIPKVSENEILSKINNNAEILDIFLVRNIKENVEYELHLNYRNTLYAAVFDGENGSLKYFSKDLRKYNSVK